MRITKPNKKGGESGVFSYARDQQLPTQTPADIPSAREKATRRNEVEDDAGNTAHLRRLARRDSGSDQRGRRRATTPELIERMRNERTRATEALRARGVAGTGSYKFPRTQGQIERRPAPPAQQGSGGGAHGCERLTESEGGDGGGGGGGGGSIAAGRTVPRGRYHYYRHQQQPPNSDSRVVAGDDIHEKYEARLAALERRVVDARAGGDHGCGSDKWGVTNNPFGYVYRDASEGRGGERVVTGAEQDRGPEKQGAREDAGGGGVFGRPLASSGDEEVKGLSNLYMGTIAPKMEDSRTARGG